MACLLTNSLTVLHCTISIKANSQCAENGRNGSFILNAYNHRFLHCMFSMKVINLPEPSQSPASM